MEKISGFSLNKMLKESFKTSGGKIKGKTFPFCFGGNSVPEQGLKISTMYALNTQTVREWDDGGFYACAW